jgi:hypothetical protein
MGKNKGLALSLSAALLAVSLGTSWGLTVVDPHEEPANCASCHSAVPTSEQAADGEYMLLAEGIDNTCHICHPYDCCRIYALTGHNHPSSVGEWDVEEFTEPKTLPLFGGLITCNTCHYHRKGQITGDSYSMVRLVKVGLYKVDWTALCNDCHIDY